MTYKFHLMLAALFSLLPISVFAQDPLTTHDLPRYSAPTSVPTGLVAPTKATQEQIRYRVVLIHDQQGCGTCKVMSRTLEEVTAKGTYRGLDFVTLDYSKKANDRFEAAAYSVGVGEAVSDWAGKKVKAGTLLVVDLERQRVVEEFKHNTKDDELARSLKEYAQ